MKHSTLTMLMTALSWVLSLAVVVAWVGGLAVPAQGWPVRLALLGAGLLAAVAAFAVLHWHLRYEHVAIGQYVESLRRADPWTLDADGGEPWTPPVNCRWLRPIAEVMKQTLLKYGRHIQELEHQRTALEVRCRRAKDECEQIKAILAEVDEPILAVNDYSEVILANRSAEELLHLNVSRPEDRVLTNLIRCEKLVGLLTSTAQRKVSGSRTEEVEILDGDGKPHWYRATAAKLGSAAGGEHASASPGAVAVLRDVAELKTLQKRNAEFVSSVSHEMKTPLAGIKAYVELLADGDAEDDETREEFLGVINGQADRLQRLVENMLNLARIEAGVVKVSKQPRSLNELLEESLSVVQPSAEAKRIALTAELSPLYLAVLADRDMLLQAAINLLSNAIKYTREGGRVTLRSRMADDDQILFEVADTGVGLSEEDCQRVFEKFYRVNKDKSMAPGTGLGLPLAQHIVEDVHGGRLTVASRLGEGSTFTATLPCARQLVNQS